MVAVKLEGRLGNQLFQYAFVYAITKQLGTNFYIDKSNDGFIPARYFNIPSDFIKPLDEFIFSINGFKNIFSFHAKKAFYKSLERILLKHKTVVDNAENPLDALAKIKDGSMYEGFFQSEQYFDAFKDDIRETLTIRKEYTDAFNIVTQAAYKDKKSIVIHIRRADYVGLELSLPLAYYKKAIDMADQKNAVYIFISDDKQFVEAEFGYIKNKYISNNNEIIDLQFLINADVCILSNSSFSWWGAWLNNDPDKVVYGPKNWLGYKNGVEYPVGISENLNYNWIDVLSA